MLDKLLSLFKDFCAAIATALAAYFYGKETAKNEQLEQENKKLKDGLGAAMHGDYNRDSAFDRMRDSDKK